MNKLILCVTAPVLAAAVLLGCGGGGNSNQAAAPAGGGNRARAGGSVGPGGVTDFACPKAADVAAVVGTPVELKIDRTAECYYETADFKSSVSIQGFPPGMAEKGLEKMKASAKIYRPEVEVEDAGLGERSYVLVGGVVSAQGMVVAGGRGYWVSVGWPPREGGDRKGAVIKLLKMMLG